MIKALGEINSVFAQQLQCFAVLHAFGDRLLTEPLGDVHDRFDEVLVCGVVGKIADERRCRS